MNQVACMANLWLFSSLSFDEKQKLRAMARKRVYEKGEFIFLEGEPCEGVFLLTSGRSYGQQCHWFFERSECCSSGCRRQDFGQNGATGAVYGNGNRGKSGNALA